MDLDLEVQIQKAVSLVKDKKPSISKMEAFRIGEVVHHSAWSPDHYMWLLRERKSLVYHIKPSDEHSCP